MPSRTNELAPRSIAVVLGTRPEIIKLSGIVSALGEAAVIVHTGQHYDPSLSDVFFSQFGMPPPHHQVSIGGETRAGQIGNAILGLEDIFGEIDPLAVVIQGDTNTVAAGAVAANAMDIPIVHVEAGLRSFDRAMPEEHNRVMADHLSDLCLAPTTTADANLRAEGIPSERVVITGNTVVEALVRLMPPEGEQSSVLSSFDVERNQYALATFHRPENVDDPGNLAALLASLAAVPIPVLLPLHPRTVRRIQEFGLSDRLGPLHIVEPVGYREFLSLGANAALLISDSGGVQEEVSVYKRPLIVVRRSTERPEVMGTFAELVAPGPMIATIAAMWLDDLEAVHERLAHTPSPYGDASAVSASVDAICGLIHA